MQKVSLAQGNNYNSKFTGRQQTRLVAIERHPQYEALTYETEATTGKKWGVGLASFFCSGLGQAINGQWGKAIGFFLGGITAGVAAYISAFKGKLAICILMCLAQIGLDIWSIVDAVKNAKSVTTQIVPNKSSNSQ